MISEPSFENAAEDLSKRPLIPKIEIYIIRHGESEGNADKTIRLTKPDNALRLTAKGRKQAYEAAQFMLRYFKDKRKEEGEAFGKIRIYSSPFDRGRETTHFFT